jgi:hypothetical protein
MSHTGTAGLPNPENRSCPGTPKKVRGSLEQVSHFFDWLRWPPVARVRRVPRRTGRVGALSTTAKLGTGAAPRPRAAVLARTANAGPHHPSVEADLRRSAWMAPVISS